MRPIPAISLGLRIRTLQGGVVLQVIKALNAIGTTQEENNQNNQNNSKQGQLNPQVRGQSLRSRNLLLLRLKDQEQTSRISAPSKKLLLGASVLLEQDNSQEQRLARSRLKLLSILEEYQEGKEYIRRIVSYYIYLLIVNLLYLL